MAEATEVLDVDAGLDGEHHSLFEHGLVAAVEEWGFVPFEPDRVADVVAQVVRHTQISGKAHGGKLDLADRHSWRHDLERSILQSEHRGEGALLLGRRFADDHRPLELAQVAVDIGARAAHQDVTFLYAMPFHEAVGHGRRAPRDEHRDKAGALEAARPPARHLAQHLLECLGGAWGVALHLGLPDGDRRLHSSVGATRPVAAELNASDLGG